MNDDYDNNMTEEEQELIRIERLSQKLERMYKDMEEIRRENLLFESYLIRNQKDEDRDNEQDDKKQKQKKKGPPQDQQLLTKGEKYEIAQFESEALKQNIDKGRIKSDSILETLRAILEETDMAITAIRKDAFEFQREILIGGENSRTGKIEAERIAKYFEEKLRSKDAEIEKLKSKKQTYESQIYKTNSQIIKKEEMGDDLKFIDFHQLQIENKKYVKEIDEKNKKLLSLKISTGKISSILIDERTTLQNALNNATEQTAEIAEKKKNITKIEDSRLVIQQQIQQLDKKKRQLKFDKDKMENAQKGKEGEVALDTMGYLELKKQEQEVLYAIKNLQRKIEIAELSYKKAYRIVQQFNQQQLQQQQFQPQQIQ